MCLLRNWFGTACQRQPQTILAQSAPARTSALILGPSRMVTTRRAPDRVSAPEDRASHLLISTIAIMVTINRPSPSQPAGMAPPRASGISTVPPAATRSDRNSRYRQAVDDLNILLEACHALGVAPIGQAHHRDRRIGSQPDAEPQFEPAVEVIDEVSASGAPSRSASCRSGICVTHVASRMRDVCAASSAKSVQPSSHGVCSPGQVDEMVSHPSQIEIEFLQMPVAPQLLLHGRTGIIIPRKRSECAMSLAPSVQANSGEPDDRRAHAGKRKCHPSGIAALS